MEVSFPALAHRVTVFGSTRNMVATSAGVSSGSASGVRADMLTASPPGPVLRSCVFCCSWLHWGACRGCPIWSAQTILPSPAVTSRPPGAKVSTARYPVAPPVESRCVILATRIVATGGFGKVIRLPQLPRPIASSCCHLARSRRYMVAASSNSLFANALTAADTSATD
jgi:hypothetical protein